MLSTLSYKIGSAIVGLSMVVGGWFGYQPPVPEIPINEPQIGASFSTPDVRALFETTLASAITSAATSMTLSSATDIDGTTLASSTYGFIIDEGTSIEEMVLADCTGTTCTNMTRGISGRTATTTVSSLQFAHRRGASVKMTDAPALVFTINALKGRQKIENILRYDGIATTSIDDDNDNLVSVGLLNYTAFNGAGVIDATNAAKGVVELATGAEAASSTASGSSGPLAIPASIATDTPSSNTAANRSRVLVTNLDGKLKNGFLDLTGYLGKASTTQISATQQIYNTGTTTLATTTLDMRGLNDTNLSLNGVPWTLIASTTVTSNTATATLAIPNRRHIQIIVSGRILTNGSPYLILNGDSAINYSYHNASSTAGVENKGVGQRKIPIATNGGQFTSYINFFNPNTTIKSLRITSVGEPVSVAGAYSSTTAPFPSDIAAVWATSTAQQVTNFSITGDEVSNGSGGVAAGTVIQVYGSGF